MALDAEPIAGQRTIGQRLAKPIERLYRLWREVGGTGGELHSQTDCGRRVACAAAVGWFARGKDGPVDATRRA